MTPNIVTKHEITGGMYSQLWLIRPPQNTQEVHGVCLVRQMPFIRINRSIKLTTDELTLVDCGRAQLPYLVDLKFEKETYQ